MGRKNYSREERKTMIVTVFEIAIQNRSERWLTPYQIAKRIGMSNCPSLRTMIDELIDDNWLMFRPVRKNGRWPGFEYSLLPHRFTEPQARTIAFKVNGKDQGQLELKL